MVKMLVRLHLRICLFSVKFELFQGRDRIGEEGTVYMLMEIKTVRIVLNLLNVFKDIFALGRC